MLFRSRVLIALAASAAAPTISFAAEPTYEELLQRVEQLEARLTAIAPPATQPPPTTVKIEQSDLRSSSDEALLDAQRRALHLDNAGLLAGHDGTSFVLKSEDGNFVLRPGFQLQFNHITNIGEDADGDNRVDDGFQLRRARLELTGNVFSPKVTYGVVWGSDRAGTRVVTATDPAVTTTTTGGGSLRLEDAWVRYAFSDDWAVRAGQFKDPVAHEELVSSKRLLAAERSLLNELLLGGPTDRVQGVSLIYGGYAKENPFSAELAFHDGIQTLNTDFRDSGGALGLASPDYGIGGRAEYKLFGDWKNYADFTAKGTKDNLFVVGAGGEFTGDGDANALIATADAQFETGPVGLYGAVALNDVDLGDGAASGTNYGVLAQASYLLNEAWEVFGRGNIVFLDDDFELNGEDAISEYTVGVNWYLGEDGKWGHRAKITVDAGVLPDGAPNVTGIGVLASEEAQYVIRAQFQLLL